MAQAALNSAMDTAKSIPDKGVSGTIVSALQGKMSANDAKAKKYKKLYDDFMKYDGTSSDIFSDLDDLESAFNTGFNKGAGTYGEFDTSQSRAWTVAASNDENNISKKVSKIDKTNSSKTSTTNLLFKQLKSDAVNNTLSAGIAILGQSGEAKINNVVTKGPKQGRSFVMYDPSHQMEYVSGEGAVELSHVGGGILTSIGAIQMYQSDTRKYHDNIAESAAHIGGSIGSGELAGVSITGLLALIDLIPGVDIPAIVIEGLGMGASMVGSAFFDSKYDSNRNFRKKVNSFGDEIKDYMVYG